MNMFKVVKKGKALVVGTVALGMVAAVGIHNGFNSAANSYEDARERLIATRNEFHSSLSMNDDGAEDEVVRAIVELQDEAVVDKISEKEDITEYSTSLKYKEEDIIEDQESVIKRAEKITGNEVENQSAYLVNSFSIDATRGQMRELAKLDGVEKVYESTVYEPMMTTAIEEGNVLAQFQDKNYGHTGEGTVIAIIDTGVNYKHQDMVLDDGVKTKFTEEEWKEKIELLGYGTYHTEKVPFGYDYIYNKNSALRADSEHGCHVSSVAAGNNDEISGVAPNAQILGLCASTDGGGPIADAAVNAIEDAVKLGADVINMSFSTCCVTVTDGDYLQKVVEKASEEGIICAVAVGNKGTSTSDKMAGNILDMKDTSTVDSPGIAESCIAVASAEKTYVDGEPTDGIVMAINTSWGPTNELGIKPEITALGGNIKAAFTGINDYAVKSGTSIASPYISGAEAIMLQEVQRRGYALNGKDLSAFLKASLMNTADPIENKKLGTYYSVRQQGSGMVDVYGAVKNDVIVTYNDKAKVELGEITSDREIDLTLTNYGTKNRTYSTNDAQLYADYTSDIIVQDEVVGDYIESVYGIKEVEGASVRFFEDKVVVNAGETVTVKAIVELGDNFKENSYVEGFIRLEGDETETIGLPVLGFYGDFDEEPIIDKSVYDEGQSFLSAKNELFDSETGIAEMIQGEIGALLGKTISRDTEKMDDSEDIVLESNVKDMDIDEGGEVYIKYNKLTDIVLDKNSCYYGEFKAEEDGYVTLEFDIVGSLSEFNIYKIDESDSWNEIEPQCDFPYGVIDKEIKVEKGYTYAFKFRTRGTQASEDGVVGTIRIRKSDGSNYNAKITYDGDKVAFSPNGDGIRDVVIPVATKLRNAELINIKVLNEKQEVIRNIGNVKDMKKLKYSDFYGSIMMGKFTDKISGEGINWDGRLYNSSSAEMEVVPEGQYYIQIEAYRTEKSEPQVIIMPVKIDLTAPIVSHFEVIKKDEQTYVEIKAEDNIAMSNYCYIDIDDGKESNSFAIPYYTAEIDEEGNYVINLGKLNNNYTITFMIEDEAGNVVFKIVNEADVNEELEDNCDNDMLDYECDEIELVEGVSIELKKSNIGYMYDAINGEICFRGKAPNGSNVTINGVEAKIEYFDGPREQMESYEVTVPYDAKSKTMQCHIIVNDFNGKEIYNDIIDIIVEARPTEVEVIDTDNVWSRFEIINECMTAAKCDNVTYPYSFQVKVPEYVDLSNLRRNILYHKLGDCFWEYKSFEQDALNDSEKLVIDYEKYDKKSFITDRIYFEQEGNLCTFTVFGPTNGYIEINTRNEKDLRKRVKHTLYFCDTEEKINKLVALRESKFCTIDNVSDACISKEDLNEDGTYTIKGSMDCVPEYIKVCGKEALIDEDNLTYSADVDIQGGHTRIIVEMKMDDEIITTGATLFYEDMNIDISGISEGSTDKEILVINGSVTSHISVNEILVNGDMIYSGAVDVSNDSLDNPFEKVFTTEVKLKEGKNIITVTVENAKGVVEKRTFEVEYVK